jgi:hypothetical protein
MELLLAIVCGGLAAFLCLLWYLDVAPKAGLYKILRRFTTPPESLLPKQTDAPYRRLTHPRKSLHKPILLNLETSEGSGQAVHPDVLYIEEGFGPHRWPYWMVCTPYPYGDDHWENPEIFVSRDGMAWSIPEGLNNPLVTPPAIAGDHYSDPDIVHYADELWLFYRETTRSTQPTCNILYLKKSKDGVSWSEPVEILRENEGRELLSPAVIHDGKRFVLWTIERAAEEFRILRRCSENGVQWSSPETGTVTGMGAGRHLWHIDVIRDAGRLSAALVSCVAMNGGGSRLHYAYSLDEGLHWRMSDFILEQAYEFESQLQYRGSLRKLEGPGDRYQLWYSAASRSNMFSIAYLPMVRVGETLVAEQAPEFKNPLAATAGR